MRPGAIVLSLFLPGAGQALMRRNVGYLLLLLGYGGALDVVLVSKLWFPQLLPGSLVWLTLALAGTIWLYSTLNVFRLAYFRHRQRFVATRERIFKRALDFYIEERYNEAQREFLRAVKLDPEDTESYLYLCVVEAESGNARRAARHLARARRLDTEGKWKWELAQQLSNLRGLSSLKR